MALSTPKHRFRWWAVPLATALAGVVAGCSSSGGTTAPQTDSTSTQAAGAADLSGVTLNVGDQVNTLQSMLKASGQLDDLPYKISWSAFMGGPTVIAAETGGSVDLGFMAETPVIFAQGAGNPVKVVAVSKIADPNASNFALLVKKDSPIKTLSDLRGKKILNSAGTVAQYLVSKALEKAGLTTHDVHLVNLQQGGQQAYDRGDVDVEASGGPPLAIQLATGKDRELTTGAGLLPGVDYLVARSAALEDTKRSAAIADFVTRLAKAQAWWTAHPDEAAKAVAPTYKVPEALAKQIVSQAPFQYVPIDNSVIADYQSEADFFQAQGLLKSKVDGAAEFDDRFNASVTAAMSAASS